MLSIPEVTHFFLLNEDRDGFRAVLYKQPISSEKSDFPVLAERAQFRDFSLAVFLLLRGEVFPDTNFGKFFQFFAALQDGDLFCLIAELHTQFQLPRTRGWRA